MKKIAKDLVDISGRAGLDISGWTPLTPREEAAEYYVWDWEFGETPELSSTVFAGVNDNWTYTGFGPGGDGNNFVLDER